MSDEASTPKQALDNMREGAERQLGICYQKLGMVMEALDKGEFMNAHNFTVELQQRLSSLATAESYLSSLLEVHHVRARDMQVGMVVDGPGTVEEIDTEQCPCGKSPEHTIIKIHWSCGQVGVHHEDDEIPVRNDE